MSDIDRGMVFDLTAKAMYDTQNAHELGLLVKEQLIKNGNVTSTYQAFRCCDDGVFDIMETVVDALISECCFDTDYFNEFAELQFAEHHNCSEFSCNDESVLYTSVFCGNHWDTNSQHIDAGSAFRLPSEWFCVRLYEKIDEFVLGHMTFDEVLFAIKNDICKSVNDRVHRCIQKAFETLLDESNVKECIDDDFNRFYGAIKNSAGCDFVNIASTKDGVDRLVMKGGTKPIKINVYSYTRTCMRGDTRIIINNEDAEDDIDLLLQTKLGVGVVIPNYCEVFRLVR